MTGPGKPLLYLDVDGPLIPFGGEPFPRTNGAEPPSAPPGTNPLLARIDPGHGPELAALPCELVWATTWMSDANTSIAPILGLPALPVVEWPRDSARDELDDWLGLHWKTRHLVERANGRTFVWVDDEHTEADEDWVRINHPGRALLHRVDPRLGLTGADFTALHDWLRGSGRRSRQAMPLSTHGQARAGSPRRVQQG